MMIVTDQRWGKLHPVRLQQLILLSTLEAQACSCMPTVSWTPLYASE